MNDTSAKDPSFDRSGQDAFHYEHFLGPLFFEPYAIEVAKRIDPSGVSVALEIAAGTGRGYATYPAKDSSCCKTNCFGYQRGNVDGSKEEIKSSCY